ncbi:MAG: PKD domain-containing protein, partial [Phycisphaerae bacterium]|nr:PKD domain-containing protein [Phycisphaerae bacterium]
MILWLVVMFALWMALGAASSVRADDTNLDTGVSIVEQPVFDKITTPAPAAALGGLSMTLRVPSQYKTIKAALDASSAGDTILVASGTHEGVGFRDLSWSRHWFVLKSEAGAENTIIDLSEGEGDRCFMYVHYYADSLRIVIDGFTFRNSYNQDGTGSVFSFEGVAPTVTNCVFDKNHGSALFCTRSNATITDCRFVGNNTFNNGGAVYCDPRSRPTFINCSFESNSATNSGGAVYARGAGDGYYSLPRFRDCTFDGNSAGTSGGAVYNDYQSDPVFNYCTFVGNSAGSYGGAIMCEGWSDIGLYYSTLVNNSAKYGGAVFLQEPEVGETGDSDKQPDAMSAGRNGGNYIEHCIIAFGTGVGAVYREPGASALSISCTDIYSNEGGDWVGEIAGYLGVDGNVLLNPQFCDAPAGNYALMDSSPCVAENNSCGQMGAYGVGCQVLQLVVEPDDLIFQADQGGVNPPSQLLTISEIAGRSLSWTVYPDTASWLHLSTQEGTTPGTVMVNVHISGLPIDTFYTLLTFVSPEAVNSHVYIPVALTITEPEPVTVAAFTADKTSGEVPLTVQFADQSTGDVFEWSWVFGDGKSSTSQHPVNTYDTVGFYTVSLTVEGPGGKDTETKEDYIKVTYAPPVAAFTADTTSGEAPLTVQFTDQSTGDVAVWFWDFGDEDISIVQHPSHVYDTAGLYTVSLTVVGPGGDVDTETEVDYIDVLRPNSPPEFVNPCPDAALVEGDPYHCLITAGDPDEDSLSFTWNGIPAGAAFIDNNDGTADFSFTPDYSHVDLEHTAVFEVTDGKVTVPDTTIFTVSNRQLQAQVPTSGEDRLITNKPIVIGFNEAIRESSLAGNVTLTSAEGDALTYSYAADRYQLQVNNSSDYLKELDMIVIKLETGISDS